jgi:hypothetical protein
MCESLPFRPFKGKEFNWVKAPNDDDWTAVKHGINQEIMLRAERIDKHVWWSCTYVNNEQVFDNECCSKTEAGAKLQALIGLNMYLKSIW